MEIRKIFVDVTNIREELINSGVLVDNKIQPYYSLNCFMENGHSIKYCEETCPPEVHKKCIDIFKRHGYLETEVSSQ